MKATVLSTTRVRSYLNSHTWVGGILEAMIMSSASNFGGPAPTVYDSWFNGTRFTVHGFKLKNGANYSPRRSGSRFNGSRFTVIFEDKSRPSKIIRYSNRLKGLLHLFSCTGSVHVLTVHSSQFTVHVLNEQILFSVRKSQNQTLYFARKRSKKNIIFRSGIVLNKHC